MKPSRNPFCVLKSNSLPVNSTAQVGGISNGVSTSRSSLPLACLLSLSAITLFGSHSAQAATWDGGGNDSNWNTSANWSGGGGGTKPTASTEALFSGTFGGGTTTISLGGNQSALNLNITTATDFSLNNNTLTLGNGDITRTQTTGTTTINSAILLSAAGAWSIEGNLIANGIISGGTNTLTKSGAGKLTLGNANSYTGLTTVSAGTLEYGVINALSTGGVTVSGGTLDIKTFSDTVGTVTLSSGSITGTTGVLTGTSYAMQSGSASAILSGTGALTKTTAGAVTLSGANTYTGVTSINAGVLSVASIGDGGVASSNLGSATSAVANLVLGGGTLQYTGATASTNRNFTLTTGTSSTIEVVNAGTELTISGASINTTGALAKTGAGKLILSGANLYAGLTTVSAGTLEYGITNALSSGAVTVSGGTLDIKTFNDTVGAVTLSSGSITGTTGVLTGTSYAMQSGSASAILSGTGALTKTTAGTVTLSGANTYTGVTSINAGVLSVATIGDGGVASSNLGSATNAAANLVLGGGTLQYTGATASTNRNFTLTTVTSSTIEVVNAGTELTMSGASTNTTGALAKTGAGKLTLTGNNLHTGTTTVTEGTLSLARSGGTLAGGPLLVNGGVLDVAQSDTVGAVTLSSGTISGTGTLTGTSYALTNTGSVSAILAGAVNLTKTGAGTATISGNNTYTGTTSVDVGTLRATTSANALGTGAATLDMGGGTLELANDTGLAFNRNTTVSASSTIDSDVVTLSGVGVTHTLGTLSIGTQTLTIGKGTNVGSGTAGINFGAVTLSGNASFSVDSGAQLTMGGITSGNVADRTIAFGGLGNTIVSGIIDDATGGGNTTTVTKSGTGMLTLATANIYNDVTTISGGVVKVQNNTSLGTTTAGTTVASGAAIQIDGSGLNVAEAITSLNGDGGGTGALRNLGNSNTWSGAITIVGTTRINSDSGLLTFNVASGNAITGTNDNLTFGGAGDITVADAIATTGGTLTKDGNGKLTLSAANTYTGVTTLTAGTLSVGTIGDGGVAGNLGQATNAATNLVFDGGTLQYTGATASTNRNFTINTNKVATFEVTAPNLTITGASTSTNGGLTKAGAGILTLTGNNLHTGDTIIKAGTLKLDGSGSLASTNIIVGDTGSSGVVLDVTTKTGGFIVASTKTVGGVGTIQGSTTIQGILAPGNSAGILNNLGDIALESTSTFQMEIGGTAAGTGYDQLNVTGAVTLAGALAVTTGLYVPNNGNLFFLIANDGTDAINGKFSNANVNAATVVNLDGRDWLISYTANFEGTPAFTGGNDVALMAVPEPNAALIGGIGVLLLLRRRRP